MTQQRSLKKGILNLGYKQGLLLKNPNNPTNLKQVKHVKVLEKYSKVEVVINFK